MPNSTHWCCTRPMNRGVEIDSAVADGPQSRIREQVEMGVAVRMAVLDALAQHLPEWLNDWRGSRRSGAARREEQRARKMRHDKWSFLEAAP